MEEMEEKNFAADVNVCQSDAQEKVDLPLGDDALLQKGADEVSAQPLEEPDGEIKPKKTPVQWILEILSYVVLIVLVLAAILKRNPVLTVIAFVYLFFFYFWSDLCKLVQKRKSKQAEEDAAYQPAFAEEQEAVEDTEGNVDVNSSQDTAEDDLTMG